MNYFDCWQAKAKILPQEIISKLFPDILHPKPEDKSDPIRIMISGEGSEFVLNALLEKFDPAKIRLFISGFPNGFPLNAPVDSNQINRANQSNIIFLKGPSEMHFTTFPAGMFDLVISLWDKFDIARDEASQQNKWDKNAKLQRKPLDYPSFLKDICRLLKNNGQFGIVTYLDGSPAVPLGIIKKIIKNHRDWPLKLFESSLPSSASAFRKMLYKAGLGDIRAWEDNISCPYQSPDELQNDIFAVEGGLFFNAVPDNHSSAVLLQQNTADYTRQYPDKSGLPEYILVIKREFMQETKGLAYPLEINYALAAATGLVMK